MKYILYGHGGAYNHGAEAILQTTMSGIYSVDKDAKIFLSSHFPEQDREFNIAAHGILERNMEYVELEKREREKGIVTGRYDKEIYHTTIEAMDCDTIALSVGGDNYCYPAWHRWRNIHEEALARGARDILWSCSINPENIDDEMRATLATHHLIVARESLTYQGLMEQGLTNAKLCADVAFLLEPKPVALPQNFIPHQTVAVNVSPLVMRRETSKGIVKAAILNLMNYILEKTQMNIALVPHVVMSVDNDYEALSELAACFEGLKCRDRIILCSDKLSAAEYKYIISQCRFGIFARTHASIAAYSSGIPTLVLGYSVKAQGIAKDMGMGEYVVDVGNLSETGQLRQKFERLLQEEEMIKRITCANAAKMKILAAGMFDCLK